MKISIYKSIKSAKALFAQLGATGFQSYSVLRAVEVCVWRYKLLSLFTHPFAALRRLVSGRRSFRVYVFYDDAGLPLVALPLYINDDVVWCVAGDSHDLDYIDVVYANASEDALREAVRSLVPQLVSDGIHQLSIRRLAESSRTNMLFGFMERAILGTVGGVKIDLGTNFDEYFARLSKHVRQNVRTAYNRLERDRKSIAFEMFSTCGIGDRLESPKGSCAIVDCKRMYSRRQKARYNHKGLAHWVWQSFCDPLSLAVNGENGFLAVLRSDGRAVAFMEGYVNARSNSLEVPRLAIDEDFLFYSPGLVLISELAKWLYGNSYLRVIDLCRGCEKYKFDMGGSQYNVSTVLYKLDAAKVV